MLRCLVPALLAFACGSSAQPAPRPVAPPPRPTPPRPPAAEDPAKDDAVAAAVRAHEVLSALSVVPARSEVLANAAMEAAAAAVGQPLEAVAWSGDGERDRGLLKTRVAGVLARATIPLPPDLSLRIARAMATAARNPHAFALDAAGVGNLVTMVSGMKGAALGFEAHAAGGQWVVSAVVAGSPAQAAGMQPGDRLIELDGRPFDEQSLLAALLVVPDQRVIVEAEMGGIHSPYRKQLQLMAAPVARPIADSRVLAKGVGYLRIHYLPRSRNPQEDAAAQVKGALGELDRKKVGKLVIDLRDNPGGSPFDVASLLVRGDPLLEGQVPGKPAEPLARSGPVAPLVEKRPKLAVLVNAQSYSAAEMVALALQGHGEARVFGQPTGGALTFPGQAQLPGGVTLFFPEALVLGPTGSPPAGQRVRPDEPVPSTTAADIAAGKDPQLAAAVAWLTKR